jgi:protoporphyrinogen/coproporphyrinogen III oxidase
MNVAVVGGGAAGLAAAWELAGAGARVTLIEALPELGGRVRSDMLGEHVVDPGVQLFGSSFRTVFRVLRAAGLFDRLERAPGRDAVCRNGRIHAVTYGSISSMLASGALSTRLKLRLGARYLPFLARHARGLDANALVASGGVAHDDRSAADFGRAELGDEFIDALVHPLLAAYYGTSADVATAALLHALALAGMDVEVFAARGGFGSLVAELGDALVQKGVVLRVGQPVTAISIDAHGATLQAAGAAEHFDGVVVATPAHVARTLLHDQPALAAWLEHVRMQPTATLALQLDGRVPGGWFGLSFPLGSRPAGRLAAICVQRNKRPRAPHPDGDALVVLPSPRIADTLAASEPQAIVDALVPAVEEALPGIEKMIVRARTYRFEHGYTVYHTGYLTRLAGLATTALPPRLALAGDYLGAPTVEGAARSGEAAARALLGR